MILPGKVCRALLLFAAGIPAPAAAGARIVQLTPGQTLTLELLQRACDGQSPGKLVLPRGTVNLPATLVVPSFCTIAGQGKASSRILLAAHLSSIARNSAAIINTQQPAGCTPKAFDREIHLNGFTLDMNAANQDVPVPAIWMGNLDGLTLESVEVSGGMVHIGDRDAACDAAYTTHIVIRSSYFHGAGKTLGEDEDSLQFLAQYVTVTRTTLGPSTDSGVGLLGGSPHKTEHLVFTGDTFVNNEMICGVAGGPPIGRPVQEAQQNWDVTVSHNTLRCDRLNSKKGDVAFGIYNVQGRGWTVTHNTIFAEPAPVAVANTAGAIYFEAASDSVIASNKIEGSIWVGIAVVAEGAETTQNVAVLQNTIRQTNSAGILIRAENYSPGLAMLQNVHVEGNRILNPGQHPFQGHTAGYNADGIDLALGHDATGMAKYEGVVVRSNTVVDNQPSPTMQFGINYLGQPVASVEANHVSGAKVAPYGTGLVNVETAR